MLDGVFSGISLLYLFGSGCNKASEEKWKKKTPAEVTHKSEESQSSSCHAPAHYSLSVREFFAQHLWQAVI